MSDNAYVAAKVREAIGRAGNDAAAAQRLLIAWCGRDDQLLRGLIAPFIRGIVAHAVQKGGAVEAKPAQRLTHQALDDVIGHLGRRIGAKSQPRGMTALINPPVPPAAGEAHQQSLRKLAAAFARKRLEQR
ncbi:MAG TPA: hypothetical protein VFO41_10445 [Alphaproteobacteria bacterium]|nr:hypothetical protein [Alphaproteobacteria bacterium]